MTREEIIRNLKYTMEKHKNDRVNTFDTDISVMCKDILDYLEQEPTEKPMTVDEMEREYEKSKALFHKIVECDDAVSRKKAIWVISACDGKSAQIEALEQLPPVTQKPIECEDAISREAAINIASLHCLTIDETVKAIKQLPPVTQKSEHFIDGVHAIGYREGYKDAQKQKSGHWIHFAQSDDCSLCGWSTGKYGSPSNYCPNCGAKMESEE